jgi:spore coat protein CotH
LTLVIGPFLLQLACTPGTVSTVATVTDTATDSQGGVSDSGVEGVPGVDEPEVVLFAEDEIPLFEIEVSRDNWEELKRQTMTDQWYVEADFVHDGQRWESIGIRTKGENSFRPIEDKASLKLKFDFIDSDQEFHGLHEVTLQAMNEDYSMMHERVAYKLYREAGVPAARTQHAQVVINGESYGLYTNLETVDKRMMRQWFEDDDGPLFEVWDVDFYDAYIPYFQLEYGNDDRTRLQATADAMELSPAAALEAVQASFDLDLFLRYWAVSAFVGQYDSYPYREPGDDCHVYDDPTSGQLKFIPHGTDETWYDQDKIVYEGIYGVMGEACLAVPACFDALEEHVFEILALAEQIDLLGYFDRVRDQISELAQADTHRHYDYESVQFYQAYMREMIEGRRDVLTLQFGR